MNDSKRLEDWMMCNVDGMEKSPLTTLLWHEARAALKSGSSFLINHAMAAVDEVTNLDISALPSRRKRPVLTPAPPVGEVGSRPNGEPNQPETVTTLPSVRNNNRSGPQRSVPGQGQQCLVFVMGRADKHADSIVPSYGQISAGCGPNLGEDFAETHWPVVVKVKPHVVEGDLIQHLRDLADQLANHIKPEDLRRTLADNRRGFPKGESL